MEIEIREGDRQRLEDGEIFGLTFEVRVSIIEPKFSSAQIATKVIDYVESLALFDGYDDFYFTIKYKNSDYNDGVNIFWFDVSIDGIES